MKKVAIMQPYFFPYLGYFSLIKHTDDFILFDSVQSIRHGWIERNRVLKQNEGWLYIKVPLIKHGQDTLIRDLLIDNSQNWQAKLNSQLQTYKKIAPNYYAVNELINGIIGQEFKDIVSLNKAALEAVFSYLGFDKQLVVFSKANITIEEPKAPDEWALNICKALGDVSEYWNPPGGQSLFDPAKYSEAGIELKFQTVTLAEYDQKRQPFEEGLSIIDVLMFNSPAEVNTMLDRFEIV